jgi:uncharacterized protein YyaL (SSP411 family)
LKLAAWNGDGRYREAAERALRLVAAFVDRYPTGFAQWLAALDFALADVVEVAIAGGPDDPATKRLLAPLASSYRPNQVLAVAHEPASSAIPLLADRVQRDGRPTAYVCRRFVCRLPVTEPDDLVRELGAVEDGPP